MKKPTSKSASAHRKASLQSGTSKKTADTESLSQRTLASKFDFIITRGKKRTPAETRRRLIKIGVLTEAGELTEHYKPLKAKAKPKKAATTKTATKKNVSKPAANRTT